MHPLKKAIDAAGGVPAVAMACGKTPRAIYKWIAAECLPRTEYTGETDYAKRIAQLAAARGEPFDDQRLLNTVKPTKSVA